MDIALNTDFVRGVGSPQLYLQLIAEAGFTHLHWCHQWCTDFLYSRHEMDQYAIWLKEYGLQLLDIHGSAGNEKCWFSLNEYERRAGVELVANRVIMLHELGGTGSLMMHIPPVKVSAAEEQNQKSWKHFEALKRSLDDLMPLLEKYTVRIAVENTFSDSFEMIAELMKIYPEKYMGITYDSGHGNIAESKGQERLEGLKHRLQALHLNDNDTSGDQHKPPFMGTVDWERMAKQIATSSYTGRPMSFELSIRKTPYFTPELPPEQQPVEKIREFLADAYTRCRKVSEMVAGYRK